MHAASRRRDNRRLERTYKEARIALVPTALAAIHNYRLGRCLNRVAVNQADSIEFRT